MNNRDDNSVAERLVALGDTLQRAIQAELSAGSRPSRLRWLKHPRRTAIGAGLAIVIVPAAALAATQLITPGQVAASLPQGTRALIGTDPSCTVVVPGVEYHCVLASAPTNPFGAPDTGGGGSTIAAGAVSAATPYKVAVDVNGHAVLLAARSRPALKQLMLKLARRDHGAAVKFALQPQGGQSGSSTPTRSTGGSAAFNWTGTVEPTVDPTKHVNGGCRAQNAAGTDWECYIGEAAVKQQIIGQGFLGQYAPVPGVG